MQKTYRKPKADHPRRGSLYMAVVITAVIVSMLALTSLVVQHANRQASNGQSDVIEARLNAESAIRMVLLKMNQDPDWRYNYPNGDWEVDTPFGNGTFSIRVVDPIDGDLTNSPHQFVTAIGTGVVGSATQKLSIRLETSVETISSLLSTLHAGDDLKFSAVNLTGIGNSTANDDASATGSSIISHNVAAVDQINGTGYSGTTMTGIDPLEMPDDDALSFYLENGTWLDISDIVTSAPPPPPALVQPPNKLINGHFETGIAPWDGLTNDYDVVQAGSAARTGSYGCLVTNRSQAWHSPGTAITSFVQNGVPYDVSAWVRSNTNCQMTIGIWTNSSGSGNVVDRLNRDPVTSSWTRLKGTLVPQWSGTLNTAALFVETDHTADFDMDDVFMRDPAEGPLPSGENIIQAGDMETDPLAHWYSMGATIQISSDVHTGARSIEAVTRDNLNDTLAQDVTGSLENGAVYHSAGWVKQTANDSSVRLSLKLTMDDSSWQVIPLTPWRPAPAEVYVKCYGQATVSWTGGLDTAEFMIENQTNANDTIRLDDAAMVKVVSGPPPPHTIYRTVLSPMNNPFGSGQTNADGIYVIDCQNKNLFVREARIVGTLVLVDPGSASAVLDGPMVWSPARSNFPALLVDGDFEINANSDGLNETLLNTNFNPTGTPQPFIGGTSDSDTTDTYITRIEGLIYSTETLTIGNETNMTGSAIAEDDVILANEVTINDSVIHRRNPPPGFAANPGVRVIENSIRKAFD